MSQGGGVTICVCDRIWMLKKRDCRVPTAGQHGPVSSHAQCYSMKPSCRWAIRSAHTGLYVLRIVQKMFFAVSHTTACSELLRKKATAGSRSMHLTTAFPNQYMGFTIYKMGQLKNKWQMYLRDGHSPLSQAGHYEF